MATSHDAPDPDPRARPDQLDPAALKEAHGRTGRMLKQAGLPFEDDEFDEPGEQPAADDSESSSSEE